MLASSIANTVSQMSKRRQLTEEEMSWAKRLQRIWLSKKKELDLTQEAAAQILGFNQSSFSQYVNGRIPLNTDAKLAFAKLLKVPVTDIDPNFGQRIFLPIGAGKTQATHAIVAELVKSGRAPLVLTERQPHQSFDPKHTEQHGQYDQAAGRQQIDANATEKDLTLVEAESDDWDKSEFVYLDKLDVRVQAGNGETGGVEVVQKRIPFMRSTLRAASVPPEAAKLVEFVGNSMEPYAFHGDTAGVNTLDRWPIKDGKVYAFRDCDLMRVKILERRPGGGLRIRSYNNEEYPPEDLTADEVKERIEIVGRVFWRSSVDY